ncbi:hypothetical protein AAHE18_06G213600 [Arachis hypogaea]
MFFWLNLILLTLVHASLICCVLLLVISTILLVLFAALSLALSSMIIFDLHEFSSSIMLEHLKMAKDDIELGVVLIVVYLIQQGVGFVLSSKHNRQHNKHKYKTY